MTYIYVISMDFFFNDTATTEIYTYGHTLSLHDALPILSRKAQTASSRSVRPVNRRRSTSTNTPKSYVASSNCRKSARSEEHTSELQSLMRISYAVFCLKKKTNIPYNKTTITTTT